MKVSKNPSNLPVLYNPSGYVLGERDITLLNKPVQYEVMFERKAEAIPDALVIILARVFQQSHAGISLLLEHAPYDQRFPIWGGGWEICDHFKNAIQENIALNRPVFPVLDNFLFSAIRSEKPQPKIEEGRSKGLLRRRVPNVEILFEVDKRFKDFPVVVKDAFVRDVGGLLAYNFSLSAEAAQDVVREAMLLGKAKVGKDTPEIVETRLKNLTDQMRSTSSYKTFCRFTRS